VKANFSMRSGIAAHLEILMSSHLSTQEFVDALEARCAKTVRRTSTRVTCARELTDLTGVARARRRSSRAVAAVLEHFSTRVATERSRFVRCHGGARVDARHGSECGSGGRAFAVTLKTNAACHAHRCAGRERRRAGG
jgi:hypothetical protein